jgi:hypothetical protein
MQSSNKTPYSLTYHIAGALFITVVTAFGMTPAQAASDIANLGGSYAEMCVKSVEFPAPYGEADLKGNAKLGEYCQCFGEKFLERAKKANASAPPPLEQQMKEEFEMRQSCRKKLNLPAAKPV